MRISVCVTTFNRAELLDRTLASLAAQSRQPDEILVSDDCSTDATPEIVARWQSALPALVPLRNRSNLYMPGNLNACVSRATGDYVANLHDADVFDPTLLEKWERALNEHPTAGFVFCGVSTGSQDSVHDEPVAVERLNRSTVVERRPSGAIYLHEIAPVTPGQEFFERHLLHATYSVVWGTVMARRAAYDRLLPFDRRFGFISDVDMWMRMCRSYDVAYVREPLIHLDDSPTAEREFDWKRIDALRRTQCANIERFYGDAPLRYTAEMRRHRHVFRNWYLRNIAALALRGRPGMAVTGVSALFRQRKTA